MKATVFISMFVTGTVDIEVVDSGDGLMVTPRDVKVQHFAASTADFPQTEEIVKEMTEFAALQTLTIAVTIAEANVKPMGERLYMMKEGAKA
jgi:hypothetical protein